jgi:hypothetical protein
MRPDLTPPPRLSPGDRVAVLSLSFAAPAVFPAVHEQAMRRLRAEFGLEPVEYPTTDPRRLLASPRSPTHPMAPKGTPWCALWRHRACCPDAANEMREEAQVP